jgi:hypothetical protein
MLKLRPNDSAHDAAISLARIYRVLAVRGKIVAAGQTAHTDVAADNVANGIDDAKTETRMNSNLDCHPGQLTPD